MPKQLEHDARYEIRISSKQKLALMRLATKRKQHLAELIRETLQAELARSQEAE